MKFYLAFGLILLSLNIYSQEILKVKYESSSLLIQSITPSLGDYNNSRISKFCDLNKDGKTDLIVNLGNCGNWGDCEYIFLVSIGKENYQLVWGPEYLLDFEILNTPKDWEAVLLKDRVDDPVPSVIVVDTLYFNGTSYH